MKIPQKILSAVTAEAIKNARFAWYSGWDKASGYIKSELRGDSAYGACRIYIKWEKKKEPTQEQINSEISKYIDGLLRNEHHHSNQKDFRHYLLGTYFVDVKRLRHEAGMSLEDNLGAVIDIIQASESFSEPGIQLLFNDLKNLQSGVDDSEALEQFLDAGKKRIGEG